MSTRAAHRHGKLVLISLALAVSALPSCLRSEDRLADRPDASQRRLHLRATKTGPVLSRLLKHPPAPKALRRAERMARAARPTRDCVRGMERGYPALTRGAAVMACG